MYIPAFIGPAVVKVLNVTGKPPDVISKTLTVLSPMENLKKKSPVAY